jgi:four helix bundle protein
LLELETQILIAQRLKYLPPAESKHLIELSAEAGRMLNALISSIRPTFAAKHYAQGAAESKG